MRLPSSISSNTGDNNGYKQNISNFQIKERRTSDEALPLDIKVASSYNHEVNEVAEALIEMNRNFAISLPEEVYYIVAQAMVVAKHVKNEAVPRSDAHDIPVLLMGENSTSNCANMNQVMLNQEDWDILTGVSYAQESRQICDETAYSQAHHSENKTPDLLSFEDEASGHSFLPIRDGNVTSSSEKVHNDEKRYNGVNSYIPGHVPHLLDDPFEEVNNMNDSLRNSNLEGIHEKVSAEAIGIASALSETESLFTNPSIVTPPRLENYSKKSPKNEVRPTFDLESMKKFMKTLSAEELAFLFRELSVGKQSPSKSVPAHGVNVNIRRESHPDAKVPKPQKSTQLSHAPVFQCFSKTFQDRSLLLKFSPSVSSTQRAFTSKKCALVENEISASSSSPSSVLSSIHPPEEPILGQKHSEATQLIAEAEGLVAFINALCPNPSKDSPSSPNAFCFKY